MHAELIAVLIAVVGIPAAFATGRYSARYRFVRVRRRYRQDVREFIRGH
jgi:hypothetical protein